MGDVAKWLRRWIANPLFVGSNPTVASFLLLSSGVWARVAVARLVIRRLRITISVCVDASPNRREWVDKPMIAALTLGFPERVAHSLAVLPVRIGLTLALLCGGSVTQAQAPQPGGTSRTGTGVAAAASDEVNAALAVPDPLLEELRRRARGDERQTGEAIRDALRLKLDADANRFLESLPGRQWNDEQLATVHDIVSGASLLRVATGSAFGEVAKRQAAEIVAAKRRVAESPERIDAAIRAVTSGDPDQERAAARTLYSAGIAAVGPLAQAAAQETVPRRRNSLLSVLATQGDLGVNALNQLALYGAPEMRLGSIEALDRLRSAAALPHWVVAAHDQAGSDSLRQAAVNALARDRIAIPELDEAERFLIDRLRRQRDSVARLADPDGTAVTWTIDEASGRLLPQPTSRHGAASRDLVDTTRLLQRLGATSAEARREALAVELAYLQQADPLALPTAREELTRAWGADAMDAAGLSKIIADGLDRDDLAAVVAALSLLGPETPGVTNELLSPGAGSRSPLARAVMHPVPQVRYEAASAIGRLDPTSPFVGSASVVRRWREMAELGRQPTVLLVETREELALRIERFIAAMGYRIEVVTSAREAVRRLDQGGDIRFIITTSELPDRTVLEFVDLIHRHPLGERIPIFIHGHDSAAKHLAIEEVRGSTPVKGFEIPVTAAGWGNVLQGVIDQPQGLLRGLPPLSAAQRFDFRRQAIEALGRAASGPADEAFDDLAALTAGDLETARTAAGPVANVAFGEPQLALLSASPSEQAQGLLASRLLETGSSAERYEQIAAAILASFDRQGVQLDSATIRRLGRAADSLGAGPQRLAIDRVIGTIAQRFGIELTGRSGR